MAGNMGSTMGYSGQTTGPMPALRCVPEVTLPEDWWDPAWLALKSPGTVLVEPTVCEPAGAAPSAPSGALAAPSAPSWRQVVATTFGLWVSRHVAWLRRVPRRLVAVAALGAGLAAMAVGTVGLVVALSPAHAASLPAKPAPIPAPSEPTAPSATAGTAATAPKVARPTSLSIPSIGVRTKLINLGENKDGTLQVPTTTTVAGWFAGGPRPGAVGSAIIAGHVDSRTGPGIFFWLRSLHRGDRIYVGRADGTMAVFTVTDVRKFAKDAFPTSAVYGAVPDPELRLITCGGVFDRASGSYLSNVVAFARLTG
jgi:sortase (surface protein transpeptidase)